MPFDRKCIQCGKVFSVRSKAHKGTYCSRFCMWENYRVRYRGDGNPKWRGGRITISDGRIAVYAPGHPGAVLFGGTHILEYRLIAEKHTGRPLLDSEIVHHVNGNIYDNRPENLRVMTQQEHAELESHFRARDAGGRFLPGIDGQAKSELGAQIP